MFCQSCGRQLPDNANFCPLCGHAAIVSSPYVNYKVSSGWWWLGFLFPIIGFILWLVWKDSEPQKASKIGRGALTGLILVAAINIIIFILRILNSVFLLSAFY
ncbi:MAG: zinc ribbon domain-containing protein [Acutalibacteraceae bacterium]|jgi:hypothetical protein